MSCHHQPIARAQWAALALLAGLLLSLPAATPAAVGLKQCLRPTVAIGAADGSSANVAGAVCRSRCEAYASSSCLTSSLNVCGRAGGDACFECNEVMNTAEEAGEEEEKSGRRIRRSQRVPQPFKLDSLILQYDSWATSQVLHCL